MRGEMVDIDLKQQPPIPKTADTSAPRRSRAEEWADLTSAAPTSILRYDPRHSGLLGDTAMNGTRPSVSGHRSGLLHQPEHHRRAGVLGPWLLVWGQSLRGRSSRADFRRAASTEPGIPALARSRDQGEWAQAKWAGMCSFPSGSMASGSSRAGRIGWSGRPRSPRIRRSWAR